MWKNLGEKAALSAMLFLEQWRWLLFWKLSVKATFSRVQSETKKRKKRKRWSKKEEKRREEEEGEEEKRRIKGGIISFTLSLVYVFLGLVNLLFKVPCGKKMRDSTGLEPDPEREEPWRTAESHYSPRGTRKIRGSTLQETNSKLAGRREVGE